jgi:hypothetical protein
MIDVSLIDKQRQPVSFEGSGFLRISGIVLFGYSHQEMKRVVDEGRSDVDETKKERDSVLS